MCSTTEKHLWLTVTDIWVLSRLGLLGTFLVLWKPMMRLCMAVPSYDILKIVFVCVSMHIHACVCACPCYCKLVRSPASLFFPFPVRVLESRSDHHAWPEVPSPTEPSPWSCFNFFRTVTTVLSHIVVGCSGFL